MNIPMVVRHSYAGKKKTIKAARAHLSAHLKYIEHRSRYQERESRDDRRIFSEHSNVANRKDAVHDVMEHISTSPRDAYYHKLILSPRKDIPIKDYRQWTRDLMHDLEQKQGKKLHWYAVKHGNTDIPHVHIIVAGAGERFDTREPEAVIFRPDDYNFLKERGIEHSDLAYHQLIQETLKEMNRDDLKISYEPALERRSEQ